jgi:hypothetical protein
MNASLNIRSYLALWRGNATALLTVHHLRRGNDALAAGYLVFLVGEGLILSGAAMDLVASAPSFAAGVGL